MYDGILQDGPENNLVDVQNDFDVDPLDSLSVLNELRRMQNPSNSSFASGGASAAAMSSGSGSRPTYPRLNHVDPLDSQTVSNLSPTASDPIFLEHQVTDAVQWYVEVSASQSQGDVSLHVYDGNAEEFTSSSTSNSYESLFISPAHGEVLIFEIRGAHPNASITFYPFGSASSSQGQTSMEMSSVEQERIRSDARRLRDNDLASNRAKDYRVIAPGGGNGETARNSAVEPSDTGKGQVDWPKAVDVVLKSDIASDEGQRRLSTV